MESKKVILVCNSIQPKQSQEEGCLAHGAKDILANFQRKTANMDIPILVKASGCMNNCGKAVCVRVFPNNTLYEQVEAEDVEEILEKHIKKNQEVERLLGVKVNRFLGF